MQVINLNEIKVDKRPGVVMKTIFNESNISDSRASMGTVSISPGGRVPLNGTGAHDQDEYGLVIKGAITIISGGNEYKVSSGQATFITRGEEHSAYNDGQEDCEIVWFLVNR